MSIENPTKAELKQTLVETELGSMADQVKGRLGINPDAPRSDEEE